MSEVDLALTRKMHVPADSPVSDTGDRRCNHCGLMCPCDAIQLADEIERLRARTSPSKYIDWLKKENMRLWKAIHEYLREKDSPVVDLTMIRLRLDELRAIQGSDQKRR